MRHRRHWIAWLALLGFVFAQAASAAYACLTGPQEYPPAAVSTSGSAPASGHCAGMDGHQTRDGHPEANPNLCQAHCLADQQVDAQVVPSLPPIAPPPRFIVALPDARIPASAAASMLRTRSAAPPHSILFVRFLI